MSGSRAAKLLLISILGLSSAFALAGSGRTSESARQLYERGAYVEAAMRWQDEAAQSLQLGSPDKAMDNALNAALAFRAEGRLNDAAEILERALEWKDAHEKQRAVIHAGLSEIYVARQEFESAFCAAELAVTAATDARDDQSLAASLNTRANASLAKNAADAKGDDPAAAEDAKRAYRSVAANAKRDYLEALAAASKSSDVLLRAKLLVNLAALEAQLGELQQGLDAASKAADEMSQLPAAQRWPLRVGLGSAYSTALQSDRSQKAEILPKMIAAFTDAASAAAGAGNERGEALALVELARAYELADKPKPALSAARQAVLKAQQGRAADLSYRAEFLAAQFHRSAGDVDGAIAASANALRAYDELRRQVRPELPPEESLRDLFSLQAQVLLDRASKPSTDFAQKQSDLKTVLASAERLWDSELDEYFHDWCVKLDEENRVAPAVAKGHAWLYFFALGNKVYVVVRLSDQLDQADQLQCVVTNADTESLNRDARLFREQLETRTTRKYLILAQSLYDRLIAPVKKAVLKHHQIDHLTIVADGALRVFPFAALHDGEKYLVERFAITTAPGPRMRRKSDDPSRNRMLVAAITKPLPTTQGLADEHPRLLFTGDEVRAINDAGAEPVPLLNDEFTQDGLAAKLKDNSFSTVHIASHAMLENQLSRGAFLLTSGESVSPQSMESLLAPLRYRRTPLHLLTLSACDTAAGQPQDDAAPGQAAFGLAGIAARAHVQNVLATLWSVNDQATSDLMRTFYGRLLASKANRDEAEALRSAQLQLIGDVRYRHACYWAPYLLISAKGD